MKKTVLKFGLISGAILGAWTAVLVPLCLNRDIEIGTSQIVGYTVMVMAFLPVFFGIREYRDSQGRDGITFGRAFKVGILIALISCAFYVAGWELVYFGGFVPGFEDKYAAVTMEKMKEKGESAEKIAETRAEMEQFKKLYKNPLINIGITFLEVVPVALVVTLIAAGILRRKPNERAPATAIA